MVNFSKKTGDYASLSKTDLKVLALAYMLEKERNGVAHLKTEPKQVRVEVTSEREKLRVRTEAGISDFIFYELSFIQFIFSPSLIKFCQFSFFLISLFFFQPDFTTEWVTPENIKEVATRMYGEYKPLVSGKGGCITTDFSMQNVLLQMGIHLISVNGLQIRKVKHWVLKCFSCSKYYSFFFFSLSLTSN